MSEVAKQKEEEEPLLASTTGKKKIAHEKSYGGSIDSDDDSEYDAEKGSGCFGRCGTCGSEASQKCSSCCTRTCGLCTCCAGEPKHKGLEGQGERFLINHNGKIHRYDHEVLLSWRVLSGWMGTIFVQRAVYIILPYVMFLALVSCIAVYAGLPSARKLDTSKFNDFVNYIKVFIAFMLGLFLNNAFARWWSSVAYFKRFLVSIKQLMFTMHAVSVAPELFAEVERLAISSAYILNEEVHCAQLSFKHQRKDRWEIALTKLVADGYLTVRERTDLEQQSHCMEGGAGTLGVMSTMIWIWIGETLSQVRLDSKVAPPMYVRLLFLCQDCMAQVELLKTNLIVQLPFTYVHMLCIMVHLTNILAAITAGLTIGSAMAEAHSRYDEAGIAHAIDRQNAQYEDATQEGIQDISLSMRAAHVIGTAILGAPHSRRHYLGEMYTAFQTMGIQVIMLLLQPLLYQSFLVIAHSLCYPYGMGICHMPTETFIKQCHYELQVMASGSSSHRKRLKITLAAKDGEKQAKK